MVLISEEGNEGVLDDAAEEEFFGEGGADDGGDGHEDDADGGRVLGKTFEENVLLDLLVVQGLGDPDGKGECQEGEACGDEEVEQREGGGSEGTGGQEAQASGAGGETAAGNDHGDAGENELADDEGEHGLVPGWPWGVRVDGEQGLAQALDGDIEEEDAKEVGDAELVGTVWCVLEGLAARVGADEPECQGGKGQGEPGKFKWGSLVLVHFFCPSSQLRWAARRMVFFMMSGRSEFSRISRPATVVPPGEETIWMRSWGGICQSRRSWAVP